jgi:radical SAM protein (TIGR01212 family)
MQERYGEALFSIPVNLDFGCPNRDSEGKGGCTFCPEHGARAAQIADAKSVQEQIEKGIAFAKKRYKAQKFALYIQAYTGTFASLKAQKKAYETLLSLYPFHAIHIGTRPDCLSEETLAYLQELNQRVDVVIELGIQSLHDESLVRMHRGHDAHTSREAIRRLHVKGIRVYAHVIIGLKGETEAMWQQTVRELVALEIDGIKFHNLHVIRNTELAQEYAQTPFELMDEYTYAEALIKLLRLIPSHIPIIRLATDTPESELIAPLWHISKAHFGEYIAQTMRYRGITQGDGGKTTPLLESDMPRKTLLSDGSVSFWNKTYRDYYHPQSGAYRQARELFIAQSRLSERLTKGDVTVLEIGFGMGYNTFCALEVAQHVAQNRLYVKAIEHDKMLVHHSTKVVPQSLHVTILEAFFAGKVYEDTFGRLEYVNAEARYAVSLLQENFDIIFLDPFIESNNPTLVTVEFFGMLRKRLKPNGVLVASTALHVSQIGLRLAGFDVMVANVEGSDIKGVVATHSSSAYVLEEDKPYRDPYLVLTDKEIESQHQKKSI